MIEILCLRLSDLSQQLEIGHHLLCSPDCFDILLFDTVLLHERKRRTREEGEAALWMDTTPPLSPHACERTCILLQCRNKKLTTVSSISKINLTNTFPSWTTTLHLKEFHGSCPLMCIIKKAPSGKCIKVLLCVIILSFRETILRTQFTTYSFTLKVLNLLD